jgi:predicted nucleotidyltransferase
MSASSWMKEMKMLDLERIDLDELCQPSKITAISCHGGSIRNPGSCTFGDGMWDGKAVEDNFEPPAGMRRIEPLEPGRSYADLADFTKTVRDPKARERLERAIEGRGAFRRFKDTLAEYPDLRKIWFAFHDRRMEWRALEWLRDEKIVSDETAEDALQARPDPELPEIVRPFDARAIARAVADDLRVIYGKRLRKILLFGSWARGDAHPESDIDLLVVLDEATDRAVEHGRMNPILDRHSLKNDTVVTALIVSEADFEHRQWPALIRARAEGVMVA